MKKDDPREQIVRHLTIKGLGKGITVLCMQTATKEEALDLEDRLRLAWAPTLSLDLKVRGSWIWREMDAWRSTRGQHGERA